MVGELSWSEAWKRSKNEYGACINRSERSIKRPARAEVGVRWTTSHEQRSHVTLTQVSIGFAQLLHATQRQTGRRGKVVIEERTVDERFGKERERVELDMSGIKVLTNDDSTILGRLNFSLGSSWSDERRETVE